MTSDALKLNIYFGESDRVEHHLLADVLMSEFEQAGLKAAVLLRAVEGFGIKHQLRTDRFLTLSEDLPLLAIAVDDRARIERVVPRVSDLMNGGLLTLERARLVHQSLDTVDLPSELHEAAKLTVYVGRDERIGRRPAFVHVVELLESHGVAGATVLLGLDGMAHGRRRRARFFSRNGDVPLLVVAVGTGKSITSALPDLEAALEEPLVTLERVRVCKRDGELLAEPRHLPESDDAGLGVWQKLMVYAGEQTRHDDHPLHVQLIQRLREAGASGATSVRGIWGYSGDHSPHGDRLLRIRRHVPVVTTIVDSPDNIQRWFRIVDECTRSGGLVTSEMVPAFHATSDQRRVGGVRLARLHF